MPLLRDLLNHKLFVKGRIAKAVFSDSVQRGTLEPIAAIAVLYINDKPVAWTIRTDDNWHTGTDDVAPRTEDEMYWRFTAPAYRHQGFYQQLKGVIAK